MDKIPSIQILMSTYNAGKYLQEQLDSILNQRECNISVLIRDDGSSDRTVDYLKRVSNNNPNITIINGMNNLKAAKSFMNLIQNSGDYDFYAFADQDDVWDQDKMKSAVIKLTNVDLPALYCSNARIINERGNLLNKNVYKKDGKAVDFYTITSIGNFLGCGMVFNRKLRDVIIAGGMPDELIMHDSYVASICASIGGKIIYDKTPHFSYRVHSSNSIGIAVGKKNSLKRLFKSIRTPREHGVARQAEEIINRYIIDRKHEKFLLKLIHYNDNLFNRVVLALDIKIRFDSIHASIATRMSILLGNI